MAAFQKLVNGFRVFKANYIAGNESHLFERLVKEGQAPETLVIACSDSRNDPAILTNSAPGDLFSVRNVAALVPPCDQDGGAHGTSSAIEYAVSALKVKHIIVMGHALCGGMRALAESDPDLDTKTDFISRWISIAKQARDNVRHAMPDMPIEAQAAALEQAAILVSMQNLLTFPSIQAAVTAGELDIHGWYFDMPNGKLMAYDADTLKFRSVLSGELFPAIDGQNCGCADALLSLTAFLNTTRQAEIVKPKRKTSRLPTWLQKLGYAIAAIAGAAIGAVSEEVAAFVALL